MSWLWDAPPDEVEMLREWDRARRALTPPEPPTEDAALTEALAAVCRQRRVKASAVLGAGKTHSVAAARRDLYVRLHELGWSVTEIGLAVGRNHSTVSHGLKQARRAA